MDTERQLRDMGTEIANLSLELETLRNKYQVRLLFFFFLHRASIYLLGATYSSQPMCSHGSRFWLRCALICLEKQAIWVQLHFSKIW